MASKELSKYLESFDQIQEVEDLTYKIVGATRVGAVAAAETAGFGDKEASDQAAVDAIRNRLNKLDINGEIVVGEGEKDKAPMLYLGEKVGTGKGPKLFIAVDPLEGTNATADLKERAACVIAFSEEGGLARLPHEVHYMNKLVVGPRAKGKVDINYPVDMNIHILAEALDRKVSDLNIVVLNRPRNAQLIDEIRSAGARVMAIEFGDLVPGIETCMQGAGMHAVMGIGGAPEGVITAAGIRCCGGRIQAKFWAENQEKADLFKANGIDTNKVYTETDLAGGKMIGFTVTGVTKHGDVMSGVRSFKEGVRTDSFALFSFNNVVAIVNPDFTLGTDAKKIEFRIR